MGQILNALRYGNSKTKRYIISIFFMLLIGVISVIKAIRLLSPLWAMVAVFAFLLAFVFINSLTFIEAKNTKKTKENEKVSTSKDQNLHDSTQETDSDELIDSDNYLEQYDESSVKKIFYYYKVKKNHIPIMIDSWKSKGIEQCPAYAWLDKTNLHVLTIGKEAEKFELPRKQLLKMSYEKGASVHFEDYQEFKTPSFISLAFSGLLPTVYEEGAGIKTLYKKNLYVLSTDFKITNTSVKSLIDFLQVDFSLPEEEIYSKKFSPYFTSAYKLNILLKDGILSVNDYKRKIKAVLLALAEAEISFDVFETYINQLIKGRLVTKEYAEYYLDYRKKNKKERGSIIE